METQDQQRPQVGMEVLDNADHLMGTVEQLEPDHFVVQKGFFFPKSHRIAITAIESISGNEVTLGISREEAMHGSEDTKWADRPRHGEIAPDAGDVEKSATRDGADPDKI